MARHPSATLAALANQVAEVIRAATVLDPPHTRSVLGPRSSPAIGCLGQFSRLPS